MSHTCATLAGLTALLAMKRLSRLPAADLTTGLTWGTGNSTVSEWFINLVPLQDGRDEEHDEGQGQPAGLAYVAPAEARLQLQLDPVVLDGLIRLEVDTAGANSVGGLGGSCAAL